MSTEELRRPIDPKAGALILIGSMAASLAATAGLARLYVWPEAALEISKHLPHTSDGLWIYIGAAAIFPLLFGTAFLRLAKGVDPMRLALAYAAGVYIIQSWAELYVSDSVTMWPQLALTLLATLIFKKLAERNAPPAPSADDDDGSDAASGQ